MNVESNVANWRRWAAARAKRATLEVRVSSTKAHAGAASEWPVPKTVTWPRTDRRLTLALTGALLLLAAQPGRADQNLVDGLRLFDAGEYTRAAERFAASEDPRAATLEAVAKASIGRCQEALPDLSIGVAGPTDPYVSKLAALAVARCSIAEKRFDAGLATLAELLKSQPEDPDVLYEIARLHLKGWNEAVAAMFAKAPASFRVNQLSAEIFEIQGRYDEAAREYQKAIEKAPATLNLRYRLGRAILMRSHEPSALEEALEQFRAELRLNPHDAVAEFQVGQILQVLGQAEEAMPHLERAVELDAEFPEALVALGKENARLERHGKAIELLEKALELHPESEPAHYSLMLAYRNAGRRDDARRIQEALDRLQAPQEGEFSEFLRRIGEAP